jgi:hypothetical protein
MTGIMASRSVSLSMGNGSTLQANRCRADSGSTYSSSDTSNRSKTSSRRRSHRPRGCRGGSSRKKRRGGKVPKEIGGTGEAMDTIADPNPVEPPKIKKIVESREPKTILQGNTALQESQSRKQKTTTVSFADENRKQNNNISDENAGRSSTNHYTNTSNKYLPLTSNAAVYGDNTNKSDATLPLKAKTSITSSSPLPPLQDSMKSLLQVTQEQQQPNRSYLTQNVELLKPNPGPSFVQSQILPPLYHPEPTPQDPALHNATNIYALQSNANTQAHNTYSLPSACEQRESDYPCDYNRISSNSMISSSDNSNCNYNMMDFHGRSHRLYGYDNHNTYNPYGVNTNTLQMQPNQFVANDNDIGPAYNSNETDFSSHSEFVSLHNNFQHPHTSMSSNSSSNKLRKGANKTPGSSYRIERIEKQRQMMAEGGSLFVTSPKSFLMGWKSDDMPRL